MADTAIHITEATFNAEVQNSELPTIVDFWAPWCGPCQTLMPIISEIAEEYDGKVKVCKVNVDEEPALTKQFSIRAIPTLLFIKDGEVQETLIGAQTKTQIKAGLVSVLD